MDAAHWLWGRKVIVTVLEEGDAPITRGIMHVVHSELRIIVLTANEILQVTMTSRAVTEDFKVCQTGWPSFSQDAKLEVLSGVSAMPLLAKDHTCPK